MKLVKLFVYGTLMKDFCNYNKYLLYNTVEIKKAYVYGRLYHLIDKECPALIEGTDKVFGEVITIADDDNKTIVSRVDELEKYFKGDNITIVYTREETKVYYETGDIELLGAYILKDRKLLSKENSIYIPSGDWRQFLSGFYKKVSSS
jgi:gamma-glutamylcyclotransferase (GGCT)/AIG2-like uncharacterized protein YtfP